MEFLEDMMSLSDDALGISSGFYGTGGNSWSFAINTVSFSLPPIMVKTIEIVGSSEEVTINAIFAAIFLPFLKSSRAGN